MSELALIEEVVPDATETSLTLPEGMTEEQWRAFGEKLGRAARASAWWIGDWIIYGEDSGYVARGTYEVAEAITGLSHGYLKNCAYVSRRFNSSHRCDELSWTHHFKAAALDNAEEWLKRAHEGGWSSRDLVDQALEAPRRTNIMPQRRHGEVIRAADQIARLCNRWERPMTDTLTPSEARKQLTVLRKAQDRLAEVIEAVEYRAATLHTFAGR